MGDSQFVANPVSIDSNKDRITFLTGANASGKVSAEEKKPIVPQSAIDMSPSTSAVDLHQAGRAAHLSGTHWQVRDCGLG